MFRGLTFLGHSVLDCVTQNTVAECLKRTWTKFTKYLAIYDKVISSRLKKLEWAYTDVAGSVASGRPSYSNCGRVARSVWKFPPNSFQKLAHKWYFWKAQTLRGTLSIPVALATFKRRSSKHSRGKFRNRKTGRVKLVFTAGHVPEIFETVGQKCNI